MRRRSRGREPVPGVVVSPVQAVQFFGDCNNHTLYCTVTIQVQCTVYTRAPLQHYDVSKARREKSLFPSRSPFLSFHLNPSQSSMLRKAWPSSWCALPQIRIGTTSTSLRYIILH